MVFEGLILIFWVIYLTTISRNAFGFIYFAVGLNIIAALGFTICPESPRYLYGINQLEKCKAVLQRIAKFNGV